MWDYKYRLTALSHFSAVTWDVGTASRCVVFTLVSVNELTQVEALRLSPSTFFREPPPPDSGIAPSSDTSKELILSCVMSFSTKKVTFLIHSFILTTVYY